MSPFVSWTNQNMAHLINDTLIAGDSSVRTLIYFFYLSNKNLFTPARTEVFFTIASANNLHDRETKNSVLGLKCTILEVFGFTFFVVSYNFISFEVFLFLFLRISTSGRGLFVLEFRKEFACFVLLR